MKWLPFIALFVSINAGSNSVGAQEATSLDQLDQALASVVKYKQGDKTDSLLEIEKIVFTVSPQQLPLRRDIERKLIKALGEATTGDAQRFLCGQLRPIATDASLPILERMMLSSEVSHMARYTVGRMESSAASEALHRALKRSSGDIQAGIINTLADRDYQPCKPDLSAMLSGSNDRTVQLAVARGLGRLGGDDAIDVLSLTRNRLVRNKVPPNGTVRLQINNALLDAADRAATEGKRGLAQLIYQEFQKPIYSIQFRLAGLRGTLQLNPEKAAETLSNAIKKNDSGTNNAISLLEYAPSPEATQEFAALIPSLTAEAKVLLVRALGNRADRGGATAIQAEVNGTNGPEVRHAALVALGKVGGVGSVDSLLQVAASGSKADQRIARSSLTQLRGEGINEKLIQNITNKSASQVQSINALAQRRVTAAVPHFLKAARNRNEGFRVAALQALGGLAATKDIPSLISLATDSPASAEEVDLAIDRTLARVDDLAPIVEEIARRLPRSSASQKSTLLGLLSKTGTASGLALVRSRLDDSNTVIRNAAISSLAKWPDNSALVDLLNITKTSSNDNHKRLALEGCMRLAGESPAPPATFANLLEAVDTPDLKKRVLTELGLLRSDSTEALNLAMTYLNDAPVQAVAGLAALRIANEVRRRDTEQARVALDQVISTVKNEDVKQRAQEVINEVERFDAHILEWTGTGPYAKKGKDGDAIYDMVFAPETEPHDHFEWKTITGKQWNIDLETYFGGVNHCAAYLKTRVWSANDQAARLEMGSDDATKAWVNGETVYDRWEKSGILPRQYRADIQLKKGWNDVLLKVVDYGGGWSFCCRIRKPDGKALRGLEYELP